MIASPGIYPLFLYLIVSWSGNCLKLSWFGYLINSLFYLFVTRELSEVVKWDPISSLFPLFVAQEQSELAKVWESDKIFILFCRGPGIYLTN